MINLNEKQYMRLQTLFLCAFLFSFLLAGFHNRTWQEVFAAAVPEEKMMSETTTVSEKNVPAQQPADSGENVSDGFQPAAGETEITVYTYGEESYTVQGMMDVIHPEDGPANTFWRSAARWKKMRPYPMRPKICWKTHIPTNSVTPVFP